jgi:predicted DCC family thiol-disulfide oxidoreductase YuxK
MERQDQPTATLIYDGDCGFCSTTVRWLTPRINPTTPIDALPYQWTDLTPYGLTLEAVSAQVHFVTNTLSGTETLTGAYAIAGCLTRCSNPIYRALGTIITIPWLRPIADTGYRLLAKYRHHLPGGTPTCRLPR